MADLRIVDAPEIPTENITGEEKLPTGGSGNYSISLDSLADYTKTKKDLADNTSVDGKVNGVRQELDAHIEDLLNPHQVTKGQIGLGNVDNTADADKPVSNSTQAAIISAVAPKADKTYVDNQLTLKANKVDVYTKQESSDLVNNSISTALTPVNSSLNLAKRGIINRYDSSLTYNSGERVILTTGDIVKSTIDGNTNDPNANLTGWFFDSNSFYIVNSKDDLTSDIYLMSRGKVETLSYHAGLGRGGAKYIYDQTKSLINNGITIINGWVLQWDGKNLDLLQAGCYGDGNSITPHDDGVKIGECLSVLYALGGGSLQGRGFAYLNETTNYAINTDNVFIVNAKIIRNGTLNNWMFRTATTKEINGGGFIKVEGKGNSTVVAGNGFINVGSNDFKHNKWVLQDIVADNFTQYGVGINGGDYWYAKNIKVLNHGLTSGTLTACMGFYVYPRNPGGSKGGQLDTVYSEIGLTAQANTGLNAAAIKLQTHQNAKFSNIVAVGGYEQCLGIDSIDGEIKDVTVYPQGERVGLLLGNQNAAHLFSGQKFTLDGFEVKRSSGIGSNDLAIGAGELGKYKLDGCTIKNGKTQGFFGLAQTSFKDCHFENIECTGVRLSPKYQGFAENTVSSTGNTFKNVKCGVTGFIVETNDSLIEDCGTTAKNTTAGVIIVGNGNIVIKPVCVSSVNSLTLYTGSLGNFIDSPIIKAGTGRAVFFMGGSANNIVKQPTYLGSDSILNNGDSTNKIEFVKATGLTSASTAANIVSALQSAGLAT